MAHNKKYTLSDLHKDNKDDLFFYSTRRNKIVKKRISLKEFKMIINAYFEIKFKELFTFGHQIDINIPLISGHLELRKCIQTRSFHVLKDNVESKKQGKLVKYKVPILEDWYSVLIWAKRSTSIKKLRVVFATKPNNLKKEFVAMKSYDNIITKKIPTI